MVTASSCGSGPPSNEIQVIPKLPVAEEEVKAPVEVKFSQDFVSIYVDSEVDTGWKVAWAVALWNEAIGCDVLYLTDSEEADIYIEEYSEDDGALGWFDSWKGTVSLNTWDYGPYWWSGPLPVVTAHELGHAIGISAHTDNTVDIMYGGMEESNPPTELSSNDLHELGRLGYTCSTG